jgi:hypothetical protein
VGCLECYVYAGVKLTFRREIDMNMRNTRSDCKCFLNIPLQMLTPPAAGLLCTVVHSQD